MHEDNLATELKKLAIPDPLIVYALAYRDHLENSGFPCVFELPHLAHHTSIKYKVMMHLLNNIEGSYSTYEIPKRLGGTRAIAAPLPALLHIQRWINKNIAMKFHVSSHAHAYVKERSIITHAQQHLNKKVLFRTDIKDFFGSITKPMVFTIFNSVGYSSSVSEKLTELCTLRSCLPQGGATSPALSNAIFYKTDAALEAVSKSFKISYSRYADDLCFSAEYIPPSFEKKIREVINSDGFLLNEEKTRLETNSRKRVICGLSIGDGRIKPNRTFRRSVRSETFNFLRDDALASDHTALDPFALDRILGRLTYWASVEPENSWIKEHITLVRNKIRDTLNHSAIS